MAYYTRLGEMAKNLGSTICWNNTDAHAKLTRNKISENVLLGKVNLFDAIRLLTSQLLVRPLI